MIKRGLIALALGTMITASTAVAKPSVGIFGAEALLNAASTMGQINLAQPKREQLMATITAYTSRGAETDIDPFISADGNYVYDGLIACSREYPFGTEIILNDRTYRCGDRMARKNDHSVNLSLEKPRFDIWMSDLAAARQWGRRDLAVVVLYPNAY